MARKRFVGGNWKMNGSIELATSLTELLTQAKSENVDVIIAPPALYTLTLKNGLKSANIQVALQNIYYEPSGAFTGELSTSMMADLGIKWTLIGHSERRKIFHETDEEVGKKLKAVMEFDSALGAILCIGESLEDRQAGRTENVILSQLEKALESLSIVDSARLVIAYEPVWAIGTGQVASPAQAQSAHATIRTWIHGKFGAEASDLLRIIYGGSVTGKNSYELLFTCPDIDGFLVGGASLKPDFIEIINSCSH